MKNKTLDGSRVPEHSQNLLPCNGAQERRMTSLSFLIFLFLSHEHFYPECFNAFVPELFMEHATCRAWYHAFVNVWHLLSTIMGSILWLCCHLSTNITFVFVDVHCTSLQLLLVHECGLFTFNVSECFQNVSLNVFTQ